MNTVSTASIQDDGGAMSATGRARASMRVGRSSTAPLPSFSLLQTVLHWVTDHPVAFTIRENTSDGTVTVVFFYGLVMGTAYCTAIATALLYLAQRYEHEMPANDTEESAVLHVLLQGYLSVMCHYMFPMAIAGARLLSWILEDGCDWARLPRPGFYWHGGLMGALLGCGLGCYWQQYYYHHYHQDSSNHHVALLPLLDAFGLATPAFEGLNRLGCLSYGCCWGRPIGRDNNMGHAIRYRHLASCVHRKQDATRHDWHYPVQLYAMVLSTLHLSLLLPLTTLSCRRQQQQLPQGVLFGISMMLSSVVRLICEHYRGDSRGSGASSTGFFALLQGLGAGVAYLIVNVVGWTQQHGDDDPSTLDDGSCKATWMTSLVAQWTAAFAPVAAVLWNNKSVLAAVYLLAVWAYGTDRVVKTSLERVKYFSSSYCRPVMATSSVTGHANEEQQ